MRNKETGNKRHEHTKDTSRMIGCVLVWLHLSSTGATFHLSRPHVRFIPYRLYLNIHKGPLGPLDFDASSAISTDQCKPRRGILGSSFPFCKQKKMTVAKSQNPISQPMAAGKCINSRKKQENYQTKGVIESRST